MIEVTMCDLTAEEAFDCIRAEAAAIRSITSNPDSGEWVAVVDTSRDAPKSWIENWADKADAMVADRILERAAALGCVAGHQGPVMEPWEAHDAVCNGECLGGWSSRDTNRAVTAAEARDAAIRFMSMPYTARWHMIDKLGMEVEVDRNNNTHQQTLIWLGRVRDADKVRELIELLDKKEGYR